MNNEILNRLRRSDLNALVLLSDLLETRSTTLTAERLSRTQSAVSHSLKKLREMFEDPLLVREGRELVPTARATHIKTHLDRSLAEMHALMAEGHGFNPETSHRSFRIAAPNFYAPGIGILIKDLHSRNRAVDLSVTLPHQGSIDALLVNELDVLIAPTLSRTPSGILAVPFQVISWCTFARSTHENREAPESTCMDSLAAHSGGDRKLWPKSSR